MLEYMVQIHMNRSLSETVSDPRKARLRSDGPDDALEDERPDVRPDGRRHARRLLVGVLQVYHEAREQDREKAARAQTALSGPRTRNKDDRN